ncbi:hypothetical protein F5Y04DRAFT_248214 [Hypomontagnella monticulosa]|nr:hypothetical protein F5Y04DRAFT_248214 [Hypomontagnella monticulosa]
MSSKKRKSEEGPAVTTVTTSDGTGKKRRRLSDAEDSAPRAEKKSKKEKKSKESSSKKDKKDKKHKRKSTAEDEQVAEAEPTIEEAALEANGSSGDVPMTDATLATAEAEEEAVEPHKKKSKKDKKDKKDKESKKSKSQTKSSTETPANLEPVTESKEEPADESAADADTAEADSSANPKKPTRFIVFVGNLPYSATVAQIEAHFVGVHPTSVRLLHDAKTKKSRGIAFVEFGRYDHMKGCLKTLHHSIFTVPGKGGKPEERRINVELTAGGGGNTKFRKEKIKAKNQKLNEERARRAEQEQKARAEEREKKAEKSGGIEDAVHPSRRMRVPGGK